MVELVDITAALHIQPARLGGLLEKGLTGCRGGAQIVRISQKIDIWGEIIMSMEYISFNIMMLFFIILCAICIVLLFQEQFKEHPFTCIIMEIPLIVGEYALVFVWFWLNGWMKI